MSDVQRICPECSTAGPLNARYCNQCGYDFQGALPAPQYNLPVVLSKAALPVLVGAASVALRVGWKVLQSRWAQAAAEKAVDAAIHKAQQHTTTPVQSTGADSEIAKPQSRRTVTIRSAWSVADNTGLHREGYSEHRIDLDE